MPTIQLHHKLATYFAKKNQFLGGFVYLITLPLALPFVFAIDIIWLTGLELTDTNGEGGTD
jgi:hypothetical protein